MIAMKKNLIILPLFLIFKYFCIVWGGGIFMYDER